MPTGADNEIWSFGDEAYGILSAHIALRELFRDYTRTVMRDAHQNGQPVMRGLFHEFPSDATAWSVADQFLFGPDVLVAPVLSAGARERDVYLPDGASWTDLRTGETHSGGQIVTVAAPLSSTPFFARDGALQELVGAVG